jgi:hypothetical protein
MVVRPIEEADLAAATGLLEQLGYPMSPVEVNRRLTLVGAAPGHRVWVADDGGQVVGLLHAFFRPAPDKPPEVVVQAPVIDAISRSQQIGERWAREAGSATVSLYNSGLQRTDTHRLLERLGYAKIGPSLQMRKVLG